jgi:hypothetical protein
MKRPGEDDGDEASKRLREEQQDAFAHDMAQLNAAAMMEAEIRRQHHQQQQQQQQNPGVVHRIEDSSDESSSHQHNQMTNTSIMTSDEESILFMEESRSHRAWLHAPTAGPRHPRVGQDFQVWALPIPPPAPAHRPPPQQQQQEPQANPDRDTAGTNNNHHLALAQNLESDAADEDGGGHWLSPHGERHPRIGTDYQATSLPGPQIRR